MLGIVALVMARSRFFKYFPTPAYLEMAAVGVDVVGHTIRYLEFDQTKPALEVKRFGSHPIPVGAVTNGDIVNKEGLITALSSLQKELGAHFVHVALPEEKAFVFKTEIPKVEKKEIRGAIELLLEENVPIKPQEAIFDYEVVNNQNKEHLDVSVSAVTEKTVFDFLELFEQAGFSPLLFEVDAQAAARSIVPKGDMRTFIILNIGAARTTLSVVSEGVTYFSSTVAVGGAALSSSIMKYMKCSPEKAEEEKYAKGIIGTKKDMELFFSLMSSLSVLRDEAKRLLGYWQNLRRLKPALADVSLVYLAGKDASLPGLVDYFSLTMKAPVLLANVWVNTGTLIQNVPPIFFEESLDYAVAIGLAMPKTD